MQSFCYFWHCITLFDYIYSKYVFFKTLLFLTISIKYRIADTKQSVHVKFSLSWKAYTKPFDFDTDLHPHVMADGIAREKWSQSYFETLKK